MNMQVTDWPSHYRAVQERLYRASLPARVRIGVTRYFEPIGPKHLYATLYDAPIGPVRVIHDYITPPLETSKARFAKIRDAELEKAGVTLEQFLGDCRKRKFAEVRRIIWVRASKETRLSIASIGRLSNKDHSSVLRAILRYEEIETGIQNPMLSEYRRRALDRHHKRQAVRRAVRAAACAEG